VINHEDNRREKERQWRRLAVGQANVTQQVTADGE